MRSDRPHEPFGGLRVAAFESRRAADLQRLIERIGGDAHVSPSMRDVPYENPAELGEFANQVLTAQIDAVIFLTGVGIQRLVSAVKKHVDIDRFLQSLSDINTITRGPKPTAVLHSFGVTATYNIPAPYTWREILTMIDTQLSVANQTVAIQQYGQANPSLIAGLEARGASVVTISVYRWDLPEDLTALDENLMALSRQQRDVCLFTSAQQVRNVLMRAAQLELREEVLSGLRHAVLCSIGPTTSEAIQSMDLQVDFEASRPKMASLVRESAEVSRSLMERKERIQNSLFGPISHATDCLAPWYDSPVLRACRNQPNDRIPVWLMGQVGSFLPIVRDTWNSMGRALAVRNPQVAAELIVAATCEFGMDAAELWTDMLALLPPMGIALIEDGEQSSVASPVRIDQGLQRIGSLENVDQLEHVLELVQRTRRDLPADIPLIGHSLGPFTLAHFAIEGSAIAGSTHTKTLMFRDHATWLDLLGRFARSVAVFCKAQIAAGAQCIHLLDHRVDTLGPAEFRQFVVPTLRELLQQLTIDVPVIYSGGGCQQVDQQAVTAGASVLGLDWRTPLSQAIETLPDDCPIQGNLDPAWLLADTSSMIARVERDLATVRHRPGYIFNVGRPLLPQTSMDHIRTLLAVVREHNH